MGPAALGRGVSARMGASRRAAAVRARGCLRRHSHLDILRLGLSWENRSRSPLTDTWIDRLIPRGCARARVYTHSIAQVLAQRDVLGRPRNTTSFFGAPADALAASDDPRSPDVSSSTLAEAASTARGASSITERPLYVPSVELHPTSWAALAGLRRNARQSAVIGHAAHMKFHQDHQKPD